MYRDKKLASAVYMSGQKGGCKFHDLHILIIIMPEVSVNTGETGLYQFSMKAIHYSSAYLFNIIQLICIIFSPVSTDTFHS